MSWMPTPEFHHDLSGIFVAMYVKLCGLGIILISLWVLATLHSQGPFTNVHAYVIDSFVQGCAIR